MIDLELTLYICQVSIHCIPMTVTAELLIMLECTGAENCKLWTQIAGLENELW